MTNKSQILEYLSNQKNVLQDNYGISKIGLFGSYSRDEASTESDIDIIYEIEDDSKLSLFKYLQLNKHLEENLHSKVDLVREATIKKSLKPYIQKDIIYV